MRHGTGYKKLGRETPHRKAMLRNMATSLIMNETIETTLPKAKALRPIVEKIVTMGRKRTGDLHAIRQVSSYLFDRKATLKVFGELAERFKERPGGYLRIYKQGHRFGDGASIATLEFVDYKRGATVSDKAPLAGSRGPLAKPKTEAKAPQDKPVKAKAKVEDKPAKAKKVEDKKEAKSKKK